MELSCGAKCVKLLLLVFNTLFWASSIVLFALGIYFLVEDERSNLFRLFSTPKFNFALLQFLAWAFVFTGLIAFVVAFFGCCGALKNNRCLLVIYIVLLMLTFALQLTVGILAIIFQEKVITELKIDLPNKLQREYGLQSSFTAAVDLAQTKFECCGIDSPADYERSVWVLQRMNGPHGQVSRTCCLLHNKFESKSHINPRPINETMCQSKIAQENRLYRNQKGCLHTLESFIRSESIVFVILGCGFAALSVNQI
ncbi:hypothetical protein RDWZM_005286 [Blomia tropicalis]|uniref:Tetraspanin n=1 Tax=Blomia tropicalis TaxID=40697 RepID=A0A9Q0RM68_BLOTA|nr:hypothetical protein RDWZM_005286 [Blomia tropicalis]